MILNMSQNQKVTVIGPAIVDVLAGPVGQEVLLTGSMPMDEVRMTYGGNAHNEAVVLSRLGAKVSLVSKVGADDVGCRLIDHLKAEHIDTGSVIIEEGLATGINVVLYDEKGERRFLTNPNGSLRRLTENDVLKDVDNFGNIVSFSCMFVSPMMDLEATERVFKRTKEPPDTILVVDMVKPKNGEKLENLRPLLKYIDFFLPNEEELCMLAGSSTDNLAETGNANVSDSAAKELIKEGVKCVIVKRGKKGCSIYRKDINTAATQAHDAAATQAHDAAATQAQDIAATAEHVTAASECSITMVPAYKGVTSIDTTGAGDSFVGGFIYGLTRNMTIEDACRFANATASCCVEKVGATEGIISADEPMRRFKEIVQKYQQFKGDCSILEE